MLNQGSALQDGSKEKYKVRGEQILGHQGGRLSCRKQKNQGENEEEMSRGNTAEIFNPWSGNPSDYCQRTIKENKCTCVGLALMI